MRKVDRLQILDWQTYTAERAEHRERVMALKEPRRIHVGPFLTFLFENPETIRYQIHEMLRVEQIEDEEAIRHELETYNEVLGGEGELGCVLLIEIDDPRERDHLLRAWKDLPAHLYAGLEDGRRIRPTFDSRQVGEDRLSSVQYLKLDTGGAVPVSLGSDLPALTVEVELNPVQRRALRADLEG